MVTSSKLKSHICGCALSPPDNRTVGVPWDHNVEVACGSGNKVSKDQHKNQTVYLLYTFNNNEENKQKADTRMAKIKHCEKIHVTY